MYLNRYITIQDGNSGQVYYWNPIQKRRNRTFVKDQSKRRFRERIPYRVSAEIPKPIRIPLFLSFPLSLSNKPTHTTYRSAFFSHHIHPLSAAIFYYLSLSLSSSGQNEKWVFCSFGSDGGRKPWTREQKIKDEKEVTPRISFRVRLKKQKTDEKDEKSDEGVTDLEKNWDFCFNSEN